MVRLSVTLGVALEKPLAGISYAFPRMTNCRSALAGIWRLMAQGSTVLPLHRLSTHEAGQPLGSLALVLHAGVKNARITHDGWKAGRLLPDAARMPEWSGEQSGVVP